MFKFSNSIYSFGLKFFLLILGILSKFFFLDVLLLDSGDSLNLEGSDQSSDQNLKDKIKGLPWRWILLWTGITLGSYLFFYFSAEQIITNIPDDATLKAFFMNLQPEYNINQDDFAAAPKWVRYYFFFEKHARFAAVNKGLIEGNPEYKEFILRYINENMSKLPSSIKPDFY